MTEEYIADAAELARLKNNRNIGRVLLGIFFVGFALAIIQPKPFHTVNDGNNIYGITTTEMGGVQLNTTTLKFSFGNHI